MGWLFEVAWWVVRHTHPQDTAVILFGINRRTTLAEIIAELPKDVALRAVYAKCSKP